MILKSVLLVSALALALSLVPSSARAMEFHRCHYRTKHSPHVSGLEIWYGSCRVARTVARQARGDWAEAYLSDSRHPVTGAYGVPTGHRNPAVRYFDCRWSWDRPDHAWSVDCDAEGSRAELIFFVGGRGVKGP